MAHRPSRLFLIQLLGLWGGSRSPVNDNKKDKPPLEDLAKPPSYQSSLLEAPKALECDDVSSAIAKCNKKITGLLLEKGAPGLTICVSKKGKVLWHGAFGYCDVENQVPCEPDSRMRIASISKTIFAATVVGPLIEQKKLDIKSSIHQYLKPDEFPKQKYNGKECEITFEQLLSHTSGLKHYSKFEQEDYIIKPIVSKGSKKVYQDDDQYNREGFYQRQTFRNVIDAVQSFKDDAIVKEPGTFNYTTFGYTLLSAAVQKVLQLTSDAKDKVEQVEDHWVKVLHRHWKLVETNLDHDEVIMPKRARYYLRSSFNGGLINAPYTDLSNKWAGGGLISTVRDLVLFGNAIIDCYKERADAKLKRETLDVMWKEIKSSYALGFQVMTSKDSGELIVWHDGGALGASSVLIICPESEIVVAMLTNLGSVSLREVGLFIAEEVKKLS